MVEEFTVQDNTEETPEPERVSEKEVVEKQREPERVNELSEEVRKRAQEILESINKGGTPLNLTKRSREVLSAYGFSPEEIKKGLPKDLFEELMNKVEQGVSGLEEVPEKVEGKGEAQTFEDFGVSQEELEGIEGYKLLSEGQRLLVLEHLQQSALGRVQSEAQVKYRKRTAEAKFLGKVWQGISKQYQLAKLEKVTAKEIMEGGMETHGKTLENLVSGAKNGPDVKVGKDGMLEILYASGPEFEAMNRIPELRKIVAEFNDAATAFSKIPEEWRYEAADHEVSDELISEDMRNREEKEREQYREAKDRYEEAKKDILGAKQAESGDRAAVLAVSEVESRVRFEQYHRAHPDVEKELQKIVKDSALKHAMKDIVTERGSLFAVGFITRGITTSVFGMIGAPLAAAGIGYFMARKRALETLKERDRAARGGKEDTEKLGVKNVVDATALEEKLERFITRLDKEENGQTREEMLTSLQARLAYTQRKLDEGLVNFGTVEDRLYNQHTLLNSLAHLQVEVMSIEGGTSKLEDRLNQFLDFRKTRIASERKTYIRAQAGRGALIGASFGAGGWLARHFGAEWFGWDRAPSVSGNITGDKIVVPDIKLKSVINSVEAAGALEDAGGTSILEGEWQGPELEAYDPSTKLTGAEEFAGVERGITPIERATVRAGEGIEHSLIRQLKATPETFGYEGDVSDTEAINEWAGKEAHRIAIDQGYIKVEGGEILEETRVRQADEVAYILEHEGDHTVVKEVDVASGMEVGKPDTLETHEYVYKPVVERVFDGDPRFALATKGVSYNELLDGDKEMFEKFVLAPDRQVIIATGTDENDLLGDIRKIYFNEELSKGEKITILKGIQEVVHEQGESIVSDGMSGLERVAKHSYGLLDESLNKDITRLEGVEPVVASEAVLEPKVEQTEPLTSVIEKKSEIAPGEKVIQEDFVEEPGTVKIAPEVPVETSVDVPETSSEAVLESEIEVERELGVEDKGVRVPVEIVEPEVGESAELGEFTHKEISYADSLKIFENTDASFGDRVSAYARLQEGGRGLPDGSIMRLHSDSSDDFIKIIDGMTGDKIGQIPADTSQQIIKEAGTYPPSYKFILKTLRMGDNKLEIFDENGTFIPEKTFRFSNPLTPAEAAT